MASFYALGIAPKIQVWVSGTSTPGGGGKFRLCCTGSVGVCKIDAGLILPSVRLWEYSSVISICAILPSGRVNVYLTV